MSQLSNSPESLISRRTLRKLFSVSAVAGVTGYSRLAKPKPTVFQQYNLNSLVAEMGINDNFKSLNYYSVVDNNQKYQPEVFRPSHSAFSWNIIDLAIASPSFLAA